MARISGLQVSVFTLGGTALIADLDDCTLTIENNEEDGSGIKDLFENHIPLKYRWQIEADIFVATVASLMTIAAGATPTVTVSFNTGGNTYSGTCMIKTAAHHTPDGLQKQRITLLNQTALGIA